MNVALHAEDAPTIEPAALGCVSAEDVGRLLLRLDPAAAWLQSAWPVDRIWQAHQPATDPTAAVDLSEGPVRLEIRRHGEVVGFRRLEPAAFAFRATLARGGTLEIAVAGAMAEDARFDPTGALRALLGDTLLTGFTLEADGGDPRR
jgi:hypothetical protein